MKITKHLAVACLFTAVNVSLGQVNPISTTKIIGEYSQTNFGLTQQMAFDANDNLFLNSQTNHSIYRITPSQNVTLFAGGAGVSGALNGTGSGARFNNPAGICFMPSGAMIVADNGNSWLRYVSTGSVVTSATTPNVNLNGNLSTSGILNPNDIKYVSAMSAYYLPSYTQNIVKYIAGGQMGTIPATNNVPNPTSVAFGTNNMLYVAGSNGAIYRIAQPTPPGASYTLCAGSPTATGYVDAVNPLNSRFAFIAGLAMRNDTLYIADGSNHAIRIMLPTGEVKTYIGGNGAGLTNGPLAGAQLNNPTAIAFNSFGQMFISDRSNGRVRVIGNSPLAPATSNQTLCAGATVAQLSASGSSPASIIKWYPVATGTTSALSSATTLTPGTYYCSQLVGALESTSRGVCVVSIIASPTIAASNGTVCAGSSFTISPSGATSYSFSGGSAIVSPNATTNYTVIGSTGACSSSLVVTVNTIPAPSAVPNVVVVNGACPNTSLEIFLNGTADTYSLNGNAITLVNGNLQFTTTVSQTYTFAATSTLTGCSRTNTFTVNVLSNTISLSSNAPNPICAGASAILSATVNGAAANMAWSNATVLGNTTTVTPSITTTYTFSGQDQTGYGCKYSAVYTQSVTDCTKLEETDRDFAFSFYPNPSSSYLHLELQHWSHLLVQIRIIDLLGATIFSSEVSGKSAEIDTRGLKAGIHFLVVESSEGTQIKKFIKQ